MYTVEFILRSTKKTDQLFCLPYVDNISSSSFYKLLFLVSGAVLAFGQWQCEFSSSSCNIFGNERENVKTFAIVSKRLSKNASFFEYLSCRLMRCFRVFNFFKLTKNFILYIILY